jgi:adenosylcobinamide-GDP ribazoletransferase
MLYSVIPVIVLWLLLPVLWWSTIVPVIIVSFWLSHYFKKKIGGYTGECLGAIQQSSEHTFYLIVVALL